MPWLASPCWTMALISSAFCLSRRQATVPVRRVIPMLPFWSERSSAPQRAFSITCWLGATRMQGPDARTSLARAAWRYAKFARVGAAALLMLGCDGSGPLQPEFDAATGEFRLASRRHPGLLQIIRLMPLEPATGDTLRIQALLTNRGSRGIYVETRSCGLSHRGTLVLRYFEGRCTAFSSSRTLAPGDTVRGFEQMIVESPAGTYSLDVQHLVDPALWVPLTITVRDR